jgi:hypothetical protein
MKTKKKIIFISALLALSLTLMACSIPIINVVRGSGVLATETREVGDFDSVQLDGAGKLVIIQGESTSLTVEAEDNIISNLESVTQGNTLRLGYQESFWQKAIFPTETIIYTLTVTDLNAITFNGASDLELDSLETESLSITVNGAAQVTIDDLTADSLKVQINGTGTVNISGEVISQDLGIDGAGTVQNGDLKSSQTTIEANGLGIATVWVTDSLNLTFNGGGTLNYYGEPAIIQNINGAADINALGSK